MLFTTQNIISKEIKSINNFFEEFDNDFQPVNIVNEDEAVESNVGRYITSLVSNQYKKSIEDIANTKIGNKRVRKRNLQQVMQESFFAGANRFGNNFIA